MCQAPWSLNNVESDQASPWGVSSRERMCARDQSVDTSVAREAGVAQVRRCFVPTAQISSSLETGLLNFSWHKAPWVSVTLPQLLVAASCDPGSGSEVGEGPVRLRRGLTALVCMRRDLSRAHSSLLSVPVRGGAGRWWDVQKGQLCGWAQRHHANVWDQMLPRAGSAARLGGSASGPG